MRLATLLVGLMLSSAMLVADDHTVLFDHEVDFRAFKSFAIRSGPIDSRRPELNNPIALKNLADAIRTSLTARGLTEKTDAADVLVEFRVTSADYAFGRGNVLTEINTGQPAARGRRGAAPAEIRQADFTEATLVVDMTAGKLPALVWRGVYNDTEKDVVKLVEALPRNASKLLSDYPPGRK